MSFNRTETMSEILRTLHHFSLPELKELVSITLPEVSISSIVKQLMKYKLKCTSKNFAKMVLVTFERLDDEQLIRLKHCIFLFDKAYHNKKTLWTSVELLQKKNNLINAESSIHKIENSILQKIRILKLNAFVEVIKHSDEYFYIFIQEKKIIKEKRIAFLKPVYCVCDLKEPYLFFAPKSASHLIIQTIVESFGYEDSKLCSLDGRNFKSLAKFLKNQSQSTCEEIYNPVDLIRTTDGLNYCQNEERRKHASKLFDTESIQLQTLTVKTSVPFRGLRVLPELEGTMIESTMTISASNIAEMLQEMAEIGAIKPPFPSWMTKIPNVGKNKLEIVQKTK